MEGSTATVTRILQNDDNLETTLAIGLGTFWLLDHGFDAGDSVARIVGRYGLPCNTSLSARTRGHCKSKLFVQEQDSTQVWTR